MSLLKSESKRKLVTGAGCYVSDVVLPGILTASFARSHVPAGRIVDVQVPDQESHPGLLGTFTAKDMIGSVSPLKIEGEGHNAPPIYPLPISSVRFVGEAIAVAVADEPYRAEDAAESIVVDVDPIDPLLSVESASNSSARPVNEGLHGNVLYERETVSGGFAKALDGAPRLIHRTFKTGRQTPLPLEGRGVVAYEEPSTGILTVWTSTQVPHIVRNAVAASLQRSVSSVRVITPHVGGAFGLKITVFPEEVVIAWLALKLGRPVRWVEDRRENLLASRHAHEETMRCTLGYSDQGELLALDLLVDVDVGAYSSYPTSAALEPVTTSSYALAGYRVPNVRLRCRGIATNKCPSGAYRGVGIPAGVFVGERLLDLVAQTLGMDRWELRMSNLIGPSEFPYPTPTGDVYDVGDYPRAMRTALKYLDSWLETRPETNSSSGGKLLGIGVATFVEYSGPGSRQYRGRGLDGMPGYDGATVRLESSGRIAVHTSSADAGHDHETAFRGIVESNMGVAGSLVDVVEGDTATCPDGSGSWASRAACQQADAVLAAASELREMILESASDLLGCQRSELLLVDGHTYESSEGAKVSLEEIARAARLRDRRLKRADVLPELSATAFRDMERPTYPYGVHIAIVEVSPDDYSVDVVHYIAVDDCGPILNEPGAQEQIVGGVAMGIGNALFEEVMYDGSGQPSTSTLMDYLVPLSTDVPSGIDIHHLALPSDRTALGSKGVAEAGTVGAYAAVGTAIADAMSKVGVEVNSLPATPIRLFNSHLESEEGGE